MKYLTEKIVLLFALVSFSSCTVSQTNYEWSSLSYMYDSGPIPPKYQYNYTITLNTNCEGGVVAFLGGDPSNTSITYEFKFSKDSLIILDKAVKKSKILDEEIEKIPEEMHPIGGSLEKVRVVLFDDNPNLDRPPRVRESPYFPVDKYKPGLEKLYKTIVSFVPKNIWDDFNVKRKEYEIKEEKK